MNGFESMEHLLRLGPELALKFVVAILCGGAIGMERETTGKPAGLRTSIVVCVGSMLFTVMSSEMGKATGGEETRIAAQIVTGIGFLGAGVILREKNGVVRGMTTAAMIWLMAALGMMIGAGLPIIAMALTAASVIMILSLRRVEEYVHFRQAREFVLHVADTIRAREEVTAVICDFNANIRDFTITTEGAGKIVVRFRFAGRQQEHRELLRDLYKIEGITGVSELVKATRGSKEMVVREINGDIDE
ncbi:MAG: MgtC/SapB family protein [Candidatus Kapaibacterium sp.]